MPPRRVLWISTVLVFASLVGGAWLRLSGLEARSITHPEMYVPNIPLPEGLSEPAQRTTAAKILTGTFSSDTHPPGYYLLMLPWTRAAGTSLQAIRLPSALLGTACVPLVFAVGALAGAPLSGAVAAGLLAFNGYHIFWSQVGRMFALACFLGLLANLLLLWIARSASRRRILLAAYVAVVLAGLATHVFFWGLFATGLVWAFANNLGKRELPDLCRVQLLAFILGSPLIAFAVYQSGTTVAELSANALVFLGDFLSFAFVLPTPRSGFFPVAVPFTGSVAFTTARAALVILAVALLVAGLRRLWGEPSKKILFTAPSGGRRLWTAVWWIAAVAATLKIAAFVYMTRLLPPEYIHDTIRGTMALSVLPGLLALFATLLDRNWGRIGIPRWRPP